MFDFSVNFNVVDNITRRIDGINDRLDGLRRRADRSTRQLRDRFRNLNLRARVELNLNRAEQQIRRLESRLRNLGSGGRRLAGWGVGALMAGAGMASSALVPMNVAREYELAFKDVKKSVDGTDEELEKVYERMKQFKGVSFEDMGVAYAEAGKMGFDANSVGGFADGVIRGATALDFSVEDAIGQMGKILAMTNQMETASESSMDIMNKVVNLENNLAGVKGSGVIDIWKRNADLYNRLEFDNAEMGALSGFLEQSFVSSELGASGFKMMINSFQKYEDQLGFIEKIKTGGLEGLKDVMVEIGQMSEQDQLKKFGVQGMELISKLMNSDNQAKLDMALEVSLNSSGAVDKEWAVFRGTFDEKVNDAKKKWTNFLDTLGQPMMEIGGGFLDKITPIIEKITTWSENNKELTQTILKVALVVGAVLMVLAVLAIIIGGVGMALSALAPILVMIRTGFGLFTVVSWALNSALLANPITWIVLGIIALIAVVALTIIYFEEICGWIEKMLAKVVGVENAKAIMEGFRIVAGFAFQFIKMAIMIFVDALMIAFEWVANIWNQMGGFSGALAIVKGAIGSVGGAFMALISPIQTVIGWIDKFLSKFEVYNKAKSAIGGAWNKLTGGGGSGKINVSKSGGRVDVNVTASGGSRARTRTRGAVNLRTATNGIRG